eukprot:m.778823 g.778823  ORF g.778823 m.778823 type:complete len:722 (-) comp59124_c0_seq3:3874-6039(-)
MEVGGKTQYIVVESSDEEEMSSSSEIVVVQEVDSDSDAEIRQGELRSESGDYYKGGIKNKMYEGEGRLEKAGSVYIGAFHKGKKHGKGKFNHPAHVSYEGDFENDLYHGEGVLEYSDNRIKYDGNFVEGRIEGFGCITFPSGERYEGELLDGKRHGQGIYQYANGSSYLGAWVDDRMEGHGVFKSADGESFEGYWVDNQKHGEGCLRTAEGLVYNGNLEHNMYSGRGVLTYPNGDIYEGEFTRSMRHGKGTVRFADGCVCEGEWVDDSLSGHASFSWTNGSSYRGAMLAGKRCGFGTYVTSPDSLQESFEGDWLDDFPDGKGTALYRPLGLQLVGLWRKGLPTGDMLLRCPHSAAAREWPVTFTETGCRIVLPDAAGELCGPWQEGNFLGEAVFSKSRNAIKLPWQLQDCMCNTLAATQAEAYQRLARVDFECSVCFGAFTRAEGVVCRRQHFLCLECFERYTHEACTREDRFVRGAAIGCPFLGCDEQFDTKTIAIHVQEATFQLLEDLRLAIREQVIVQEVEANMQRELKRQSELTALELEIRTVRKHISDEILTLKCPTCNKAFLDFTGCWALQCSSCPTYFCGWCFKPGPGSRAAHECAATCGIPFASPTSRYHVDNALVVFERHHLGRRSRELTTYLGTLRSEIQTAVLPQIEPLLKELGLAVENSFGKLRAVVSKPPPQPDSFLLRPAQPVNRAPAPAAVRALQALNLRLGLPDF